MQSLTNSQGLSRMYSIHKVRIIGQLRSRENDLTQQIDSNMVDRSPGHTVEIFGGENSPNEKMSP